MKVFRTVLLLYVLVLLGIYVKVFVIGFDPLPEPALAYLAWWEQEPQSVVEYVAARVAMIASAASLLAAVVMIFRPRWGRHVFAACIVLLLGCEAMMDLPILKSPTEYFLDSVLGLLAGGIVVFSYWPGVQNTPGKAAP